MNKKKDFFISFSNVNKEKVENIVNELISLEMDVWFQLRDSKQNFIEEINKGINDSSNFAIFVSNASISSLMVRNEISRAIYQQKKESDYPIIPIVIDELTEENLELAKLWLGSLNWLFEDKFADVKSLALAIIEQSNSNTKSKKKTQSSYTTENELERERLDSQNRIFNAYANDHLDKIFSEFTDAPVILDIGCGYGNNLIKRFKDRNHKFILGIDHSQQAIDYANAAYGDDKTRFICCDITSNDFLIKVLDCLLSNGFIKVDFVHISSVLLHLENPHDLLKSLNVLMNDGAKIFIQDEDDGNNIVYPNSPFFDNCLYIWEHSNESGDREMARKIPSLLQETGFENINLLSSSVSSIDFDGKYMKDLWDLYYNPDYWVTDDPSYFDDYEAFNLLSVVKEKHSEIRKEYLNKKIFLTLGVYFYSATKK